MSFDYKRALKREFNVGSKEQKLRYYVGIGMVLVSVFLANIALLFIGIGLIYTAKTQWCPLYSGLVKSSVLPGDEPPASGGAHH